MPKIVVKCPSCKKLAEESSRIEMPSTGITLISYTCGHSTSEYNQEHLLNQRIEKWRSEGFTFPDGARLYEHQIENLRHAVSSGGKHQIQDETGLGKTASALAEIRIQPERLPVLILCKGNLVYQWAKEVYSKLNTIPQIISASNERPEMRFFKIVIVSLDKLRSIDWLEGEIGDKFNSVIIDEIQLIKNTQAKRTNAVRKICKSKKYITQLSGTPIENHAGEYFPSLNILWPERFHTYESFVRHNVTYYNNGYSWKLGGLTYPKSFFEETRRIIIRHKLADVKDMPDVRRDFRIVEIADTVAEAYAAAEEEFIDAFDEFESSGGKSKLEAQTNLAAKMQRLRHITGLAKIAPCLDFVGDFLRDTDRKIAIYHHHQDVGELLSTEIARFCKELDLDPPCYISKLGPDERAMAIRPFTEGGSRVLVASLLASGEGLDLHMCSDYVILERHWNPKKEEQVEGRGTRLSAKHKHVFVTYLVGFQTIDEFMAELNEMKRQHVDEAIDGSAVHYSETDVIRKIGGMLKARGKRKWKVNV